MGSRVSEAFQADLTLVVHVMLMKVLAPLLDMGSTPIISTKGRGKIKFVPLLERARPADWLSSVVDGDVLVSTGLVVGTGDIREGDLSVGIAERTLRRTSPSDVWVPASKRSDKMKRTIIAAPKAMAAAA